MPDSKVSKVSAYDLAMQGGRCDVIEGQDVIVLPSGVWYYQFPDRINWTPCGKQWMYQKIN